MIRENVPLAPLSTLGVGGPARFFIDATSEGNVREAIRCARERTLPLLPLGNGSNLLIPDDGVNAVVVKLSLAEIEVKDDDADVCIKAGAGASWDAVVDRAAELGLFGVENLAGIPGTVGGAAVQNIGAYGGELSRVFDHAMCLDAVTGEAVRIDKDAARFAYRTSIFKSHPELVILSVALSLRKGGEPNLSYADLVRAKAAGTPLATPSDIAAAVRAIRAKKFPPRGTAGSFFKNPALRSEEADRLRARYPELPAFPQEDGTVKVSLAWLLDHALALKGYAKGPVRLYEQQPLVIAASEGASAGDVDALARFVETRVREELGITLEREVEMFGARA